MRTAITDFAASATGRRLALSALVLAIGLFFWVRGPFREPEPVFEFQHEITGFDRPVQVGDEQGSRRFGLLGEPEEHAFWKLMPAARASRPLWGILGDRRATPSLSAAVAGQVAAGARQYLGAGPAVAVRNGLDLYYADERDEAGRPRRLYLENTGLNREIKGYAGPIDIGLVVGADGVIQRVVHLRSAETTSYLARIEADGFYAQFAGLRLDGAAHEIDAVAGATLTSVGIGRSVSDLVRIARESPLAQASDAAAEGFSVRAVLPDTWIIQTALIALLFVPVWISRVRRSSRATLAVGVASVLYLGFYLNNSFTYVTFLQPFLGSTWSWMLACYAGLVLVSAIWDGNSYCRYVCPYGNVQRLLLRFLPGRRGSLPVSNRVLGRLRLLLTVVLAGGIVAGFKDWGSFELFPDLFGLEWRESPWFWLSVAAIALSVWYPMAWCRVLCPTGAVLDLRAAAGRPRVRAGRLAGIPVAIEAASPVPSPPA
jgi:NosR/NirI family nitrous oxide reductase transcriptional regulator